MGLLWMTFKFLQPYVGPGLMLGYPLYSSIRAIESQYKEDDEQWLTYWVIYSFIALFELAAERVLELIPLWPAIKLIGICWLVLPQFRGACYVYRTYVRKIFWSLLESHHERSNEQHHEQHYEHHEDFDEKQRKLLQMMSPEARTAVAQYISEHGADAFDTLINTASKHAVKNKSPKTPKTPKSPIRLLFERKHSPSSA